MNLTGVDVASFQGPPGAWRAAAGKISFAAVKLTELSPAGLYVNPDAQADWDWLHGQGLGRVGYAFGHPATSPHATARALIRAARALGLADGDGICLDHETADGLPPAHCAAWAATVLGELQLALHRPPLLYTFRDFALEGYCDGLGAYGLWLSDPSAPPGHPRVPAPWKTWVLHQTQITGPIDKDVANYTTMPGLLGAIGRAAVKEADWEADGKTSLASLAVVHRTDASTILRLTAEGGAGGEFAAPVARWLNDVAAGRASMAAPVPMGIVLRVPRTG